jgi:hypothetical protein
MNRAGRHTEHLGEVNDANSTSVARKEGEDHETADERRTHSRARKAPSLTEKLVKLGGATLVRELVEKRIVRAQQAGVRADLDHLVGSQLDIDLARGAT